MANSALVQAHNNILTNTQLTSVQTKLNTIKTGLLDVREAIKEVDGTLAEGTIDTIGDDIRTLNRRNYIYKWVNNSGTYSLERDANNTDNVEYNKYNNGGNDNPIYAVILPEQIKIINGFAFRFCPIDYINLMNIESIKTRSFSEGGKLTSAIMPNVKIIESYAFYCQPLTYVEIGENITSIGGNAFYTDVTSGTYVTDRVFVIKSSTPPDISSDSFRSNNGGFVYDNLTIYVPYGTSSLYTNASAWSNYTSVIQELNQDGSIPS